MTKALSDAHQRQVSTDTRTRRSEPATTPRRRAQTLFKDGHRRRRRPVPQEAHADAGRGPDEHRDGTRSATPTRLTSRPDRAGSGRRALSAQELAVGYSRPAMMRSWPVLLNCRRNSLLDDRMVKEVDLRRSSHFSQSGQNYLKVSRASCQSLQSHLAPNPQSLTRPLLFVVQFKIQFNHRITFTFRQRLAGVCWAVVLLHH